MSHDEIFEFIKQAVVKVSDSMQPGQVNRSSSLVVDLGMDSMRMASLFANVKDRFGSMDLTEWFVTAARDGSDTVAHLVEFLYGARSAA